MGKEDFTLKAAAVPAWDFEQSETFTWESKVGTKGAKEGSRLVNVHNSLISIYMY